MPGNTKEKEIEAMVSAEKSKASYGWGVRHLQVMSMSLVLTSCFISRSSMSVAIIAMTDIAKTNGTTVGYNVYTWSEDTKGLILSSFFCGYLMMMIPCSLLAKRFGAKPMFMIALVTSTLTTVLVPCLSNLHSYAPTLFPVESGWISVCVSRAIMGATQACLFPVSHTLLGKWLPSHEHTTYSGFVYAGPKIGATVVLPLCGLMASSEYGWPLIFYFTSFLLALTAAVWWFCAASTPGDHPLISVKEREYIEDGLAVMDSKKSKVPWKAIIKCKPIWAVMVANIGCDIFYAFLFMELPTYMKNGLGISLKASATYSSLPYIGMWFTSVLGSALADKLINGGHVSKTNCRKICNSIAFIGVGAGFAATTFMTKDDQTLAIVILVLSASLEGFVMSGFLVNFLDLSPNFCGVILSVTNCLGNVGSFLTPIITGVVLKGNEKDVGRWGQVFWAAAAICFSTNTVYVLLSSSQRQPWDDPDFQDKQACMYGEAETVLRKNNEKHEDDQ